MRAFQNNHLIWILNSPAAVLGLEAALWFSVVPLGVMEMPPGLCIGFFLD